MALHARQIVFTHPATGKRMILEGPLPEDLQVYWDGLKG
jgi:23S rRNA-/tRNA-specific pseudouridylate synthase